MRALAAANPQAANPEPGRRIETLDFGEAIFVGVAQIGALFAGISRSGITMVAGLARGLDHEDAARFAFLLATPIIAAAGIYKLPDLFGSLGDGVRMQSLVGAIFAAVGAYVSPASSCASSARQTLWPFGALLPRRRRRLHDPIRVIRPNIREPTNLIGHLGASWRREPTNLIGHLGASWRREPTNLIGTCAAGVVHRSDREDGAEAEAGGHVGEGLVDLGERAPGGDHALEVEAAGPPERDQARDVTPAVAATEARAHDLALVERHEHGRRHVQRLLEVARADEHRGAAVARRLDARVDRDRRADRVERVVDADPVGERLHPGDDVFGGRIDHVGRAERAWRSRVARPPGRRR